VRRTIIVNDRMQKGYRYHLVAPAGRSFDPDFNPELTPREMLELGVFLWEVHDRLPRRVS
jgi:hypothetical protein